MADETLKRDANRVTVLGGVTDDANMYVTMLRVDPTTKRLKVTATGLPGGGDVNGPASSTDNAIVRFDGTGGKTIQNSTVTIADTTGDIAGTGFIRPASNDGGALGSGTLSYSDLFLASGALVSFANGDVVLTHSSGIVTVSTGDLRVTTAGTNSASVVTVGGTQTLTAKTLTSPNITTKIAPTTDDGAPLGDTTHNFSDLFLATGAVVNFANGNVTLTHSSGILTQNTGELRITSANVGTNGDSVPTLSSTSTFTNKTLTTPTISKPIMSATNPTAQTYAPAGGGTATLDLALSNQHHVTFPAGNITVALSNDTNNQCFIISLTQDGGGSRTVTWFTTIRWAGGSPPTLTTTGSKRDTFGFIRTGSGTYDGFIVGQNI